VHALAVGLVMIAIQTLSGRFLGKNIYRPM